MQISRTDLSKTEIKLTISATATELTPIKDEVVKRLGKSVKVQGFRKGTAPQAMIEKNIDPSLLQSDFLDEAMTQLYAHATKKEDIRPVTRPEVAVKKFVPFTELEFEVTTSIIGKLKIADYKNVRVAREKVTVAAKDITEVLESLQKRAAEKKEVTRAAKDGDEAVINFKGVDKDGKAIEGAEGKDYPLVLGSKAFIPGFEDNVIGMKPGDEKAFEVTFPKDYGAKDLAGAKVTFTVTLTKLNELVEPKADDDFASKVGPFKTLAELKDDIKKQLTAEREREAESKYQNEVVKAVADESDVELPQALIDQQVTYNIDEVRRNLMYQGQTFEEALKAEGKTEEEYKKDLIPQAKNQLIASIVLAEIADKENLQVAVADLDAQIAQLKTQYKDAAMQAELDKPENRSDIASRMLTEQTVNLLVSYASKSK